MHYTLDEVFRYLPSGILVRKVSHNNKSPVGSVVGGLNNTGYLATKLLGKSYLVHRIIWEMHHGPIPDGMQVDHINNIRTDNRLCNLRIVTPQQNSHNMSSVSGVRKTRVCRWEARITVGYTVHSLGTHASKALAKAAYLEAKRKLHPTAPEHHYAEKDCT